MHIEFTAESTRMSLLEAVGATVRFLRTIWHC